MKKLLVLILILTGINFYAATTLISSTSRDIVQPNLRDDVGRGLKILGCPESKILSIGHGITHAANRTGLKGLLIASLIYTESNFRTDVISRKGYKGILQTPTATGIPLIDICHGADILMEKLHLTKGNLLKALTLYKGGFNPEARKQARQVLLVYRHVIKNVA
jgi:hypothetical protein